MNREQMHALGRVLEHFGEAGKPSDHSEALLAPDLHALDNYRQARSLERYVESTGRVTRDDETAEWTPTAEETTEEPTEPRGPSVVDRGSKEIEARWAKETIGLTAIELNEAYAQFDVTRAEYEIPSGKLFQATRRLEEAMQRLGLTDDIPF